MSPKPTDLLDGRFALDARIGEGTFAEIYRATDTETGSLVAIKTLRPEQTAKRNAVALFRQEGEIGSSLSHANVVKVWNYGETAGTYFIVMELITGTSLRRRMRRSKTIPVGEAFRVIRAVLRGLEAIHTAGYIHRDIKPQNILLETNGTPKITDFGITLRAGGIRAPGDGMTLGTAAYIAPEQAAGWEIGPQADLYAVGVVLYEMLTGEVPFPGDDPIEVMHRHMFEAPRDPRSLNPEISPALSAIMLRALAKEPEARFPSAQAMNDALEMLHIDESKATARPGRNSIAKLPANRRKHARIARVPFLTTFVGALLLAVLIIVVVLALVSTAVTADDSSKDISSSGVPSGFSIGTPSATSTPQPHIEIPVAEAPSSPPDLHLFSSEAVNNPASATPSATTKATPTATVTVTPQPIATPDTKIAAAQEPPASAQTGNSNSQKKPAVNKHGRDAAQADQSNTQNDHANSGNAGAATTASKATAQRNNGGFGATQNVTNTPDQSTKDPLVSNDGHGTIINGASDANSQTTNDSGGSGNGHHHRGRG
jgi:eukaryotic-like serine/threonine-protein kinase